jgi:GNAT superfamily N-acetyltransferase
VSLWLAAAMAAERSGAWLPPVAVAAAPLLEGPGCATRTVLGSARIAGGADELLGWVRVEAAGDVAALTLWVMPGARRCGVAATACDLAAAVAAHWGFDVLEVVCDPANVAARSALCAAGFVPSPSSGPWWVARRPAT